MDVVNLQPEYFVVDVIGMVRNNDGEFLYNNGQHLIKTYKFNSNPDIQQIIEKYGNENHGIFYRTISQCTNNVQISHRNCHVSISIIVEYKWNGVLLPNSQFLHISEIPQREFRWESYVFYNPVSPVLNTVYPPNNYWPTEIPRRIAIIENKQSLTNKDRDLLKMLKMQYTSYNKNDNMIFA